MRPLHRLSGMTQPLRLGPLKRRRQMRQGRHCPRQTTSGLRSGASNSRTRKAYTTLERVRSRVAQAALYACSATVDEVPRHRAKSSRFVSRLDTREKEGIFEGKAAVGTVRRSLPSSELRSLLCAAVDRQANTGMYEIFKSVIH